MSATNYFKVGTSLARPIDCLFPFNGRDEVDTQRAWDAARDASAVLGAQRIAAWRRPLCEGPWSKVQVVL